MSGCGTQLYKNQTPLLITKRIDTTPLLGVNWLKQLPITINKISLDKETDQSETIHKIQKTIRDQPHNKQYPSEITIRTRTLSKRTKNTSLLPTGRCEKGTRPTN